MKKQIFYSFFLFAATFFSVGCGSSGDGRGGEFTIAILHTNDVHGEMASNPKLAYLLEETDDNYDATLLVSAGDMFSGNAYVDRYADPGYPMVDIMNAMGYDLAVLGNHDFDYGEEVFVKRIGQANFPFICANIEPENTGLPEFEPYRIIDVDGIELAFLGLIETSSSGDLPSTLPENISGFSFTKAKDIFENYSYLEGESDAVIGLTHLGYDTDRLLAEKSSFLDVIIGGHSHTVIDSLLFVNNTLITQAGSDLRYAGRTVLTFNDGELTSRNYELILLDTISGEDQKIASMVEGYLNNAELTREIGVAASDIEGKLALGCLITDAMVYANDVDIAFHNSGAIRIGAIEAGPVKVTDIYEMDPFSNAMYRFNLTIPEIESLIRFSYGQDGHIDLHMGGGSYVITAGQDGSVKGIDVYDDEGNALHPDSTYSVGLNSYVAQKYEFAHSDPGQPLNTTTSENIISFIEHSEVLDYASCRSATVN